MKSNKLFRFAVIGVAAAGLMILGVPASHAAGNPDLLKCSNDIQKIDSFFLGKVQKALNLCAKFATHENEKNLTEGNGDMSLAASMCEEQLDRVYAAEPGSKYAGKSFVEKTQSFCARSISRNDCDDAALADMGHLASGPGGAAPPVAGAPLQFTCDSMFLAKEKLAINDTAFAIPNFFQLMHQMIAAAPGKENGTVCDQAAADSTHDYRPDLCQFGVECRDHACDLSVDGSPDTSGGTVYSAGLASLNGGNPLPIPFSLDGTFVFEVCKAGPAVPAANIPEQGLGNAFGTAPSFLYLVNEPFETFNAVNINVVNVGDVVTLCVRGIRSEGWCDCTGQGVPDNIASCQDAVVNGESGTTDTCGAPLALAVHDANLSVFAGTLHGQAVATFSGTSGAGDCVDLNTIEFTMEAPGLYGPDGVACTSDDPFAPSVPVSVPLTTGATTAVVNHAVTGQGTCAGGSNASHPCLSNDDCPGSTCAGVTYGQIVTVPLNGSPISCAQMESGSLSGLSLVGSFPAASGAAPLGDSAIGFHIDCK